MNENLYFYKGLESNLPEKDIKPGALYHCTDTGNTYLGKSETEMSLFSTASGKQNENNSTVIGTGTATGIGSTVIGSGTASGDYSVAEGADTLAGCKGYYIAAIDPDNNQIYLHTGEDPVIPTWDSPSLYYDSTFESGYQILNEADIPYGNEFSIGSDGYYHWVFAGNITAINCNRITYSETNSLNNTDTWKSNVDGGADPMIFFIPVQSNCGVTNVGYGSHAEGWQTKAAAQHSHAEGYASIVAGRYGHAEGDATRAGFAAHSEGQGTLAQGLYSHAEGANTQALASGAHAEGTATVANNTNAHAEGSNTTALGKSSHVEGRSSNNALEIVPDLSESSVYNNIKSLWDAKGFSAALGDSAHAEGLNTIAKKQGHAEGYRTIAWGDASHSEGYETSAIGTHSHAEGGYTTTEGKYSHTEGYKTIAIGEGAHAEGYRSGTGTTKDFGPYANGQGAHAEGATTNAFCKGAHAEGRSTYRAIEICPTLPNLVTDTGFKSSSDLGGISAFDTIKKAWDETGKFSLAIGEAAHSEGVNTIACQYGHAEGGQTIAKGNYSHAEGEKTQANGKHSHAEGYLTTASGEKAHAEGLRATSLGLASHAEGLETAAKGKASHTEGKDTIAFGDYGHAEGDRSIANGYLRRDANGNYLDADGNIVTKDTAINSRSAHAEGIGTFAAAEGSHTEGGFTHVYNLYGHAEGYQTKVYGTNGHAQGYETLAIGSSSHAEGLQTQAGVFETNANGEYVDDNGEALEDQNDTIIRIRRGAYSHAEGIRTIASQTGQHVQGRWNIEDTDTSKNYGKYAHIVGNGTSDTKRSNAHTLDWDGNAWFAGGISANHMILVKDKGYGDTLPDTGVEGQIFFLKVE